MTNVVYLCDTNTLPDFSMTHPLFAAAVALRVAWEEENGESELHPITVERTWQQWCQASKDGQKELWLLLAKEESELASTPEQTQITPRVQEINGAEDEVASITSGQPKVIGLATLSYDKKDESQLAFLWTLMAKSWRGIGLGKHLIEKLESRVKAAGKTIIETKLYSPPVAFQNTDSSNQSNEPDFLQVPSNEEAIKLGYKIGLIEIVNARQLPLEENTKNLLAQKASRASKYEKLAWSYDHFPPTKAGDSAATAASFMRLFNQSNQDVPAGDLAVDNYEISLATYRKWMEHYQLAGHELWHVALADEQGEIVAFADVEIYPGKTQAHQKLTVVSRHARGLGLGWAIKAWLHESLEQNFGQLKILSTNNAIDNYSILAINEAMGFSEKMRVAFAQKTLS
ncbi:hypothetical protein BK816_05935 [Boudabousia tangfeifanii]|uniref:N-acetyltransferase domain-containing protein n=1 Tax=Boudabousia tangfeifanii TaxID=1912795 RepID=A0A1D9ML34_9ACTO|nr:GNAT family N-acetyltransferase [Boudabousia tangfeifanii]AOZ72889.1 hypothetical protein BK816_05935 [Boudabousia tangfeifanii]